MFNYEINLPIHPPSSAFLENKSLSTHLLTCQLYSVAITKCQQIVSFSLSSILVDGYIWLRHTEQPAMFTTG